MNKFGNKVYPLGGRFLNSIGTKNSQFCCFHVKQTNQGVSREKSETELLNHKSKEGKNVVSKKSYHSISFYMAATGVLLQRSNFYFFKNLWASGGSIQSGHTDAEIRNSDKTSDDNGGKKGKGPEEIDNMFFQKILARTKEYRQIVVEKYEKPDQSKIHPSFMCMVDRVRIFGRINEENVTVDVIVKTLHSKEHQELYRSNIAAENEEYAYNKIFPYTNRFANRELPVPKCFHADYEKLIIEDMCSKGFKPFDKSRGYITKNECMDTLKALAKFHASAIVLKHLRPELFKEMKKGTKEVLYFGSDSDLLTHQRETLQNIIAIHKARKPVEDELLKIETLEHLLKVSKRDIKNKLCTPKNNYTLCHGDLLLTNILYKENAENDEVKETPSNLEIAFVDFQKMRYSSVASDLVYLFFINLLPEDYFQHKEELLRYYYKYLNQYTKDYGIDLEVDLSYKDLLKQMDHFTDYGIIYALWILPMFEGARQAQHTSQQEVTKEMLDEVSRNQVYTKRMEKWVEYYTKIFILNL